LLKRFAWIFARIELAKTQRSRKAGEPCLFFLAMPEFMPLPRMRNDLLGGWVLRFPTQSFSGFVATADENWWITGAAIASLPNIRPSPS